MYIAQNSSVNAACTRHEGIFVRITLAFVIGVCLTGTAAGSERILGYINHIPPESAEAKARRVKRVAERRAGIPVMVHRGATTEAPENTLEAYSAAMDLGADGVEIDIRRSKDGVLYLFHDDTLDRLTNSTGKVRELTYYELLSITPKDIHGRANSQTRPPTLAAFLVLARRRAMLIHLDIKEAGLQDEIVRMFDQADIWPHICEVNGGNADRIRPPDDPNRHDPNAPYNKVGLIPYKGWAPTGDHKDEKAIEAARAWLPKEPGRQMVFCKDPRLTVKAMGRRLPEYVALPEKVRARWGPEGIIRP
ncbi:MAG: glycerophosphodiester phosphodiesterase family protein [Phycisphaerales bacterium]|nr:MAG: glycerophosphodiester phosphodiesterase family protein [Phycisphaerales bacterium]